MLRPGFPRLSHPEVAHAIPSVGFIAQVYRRVSLLVSPTISEVKVTDPQRPVQASGFVVGETGDTSIRTHDPRFTKSPFCHGLLAAPPGYRWVVPEDVVAEITDTVQREQLERAIAS